MDSVILLLAEAARAGLRARVDGDLLVVQGPHSAAEIAQRLLSRKAEVLAALKDSDETRLQAACWIFDAQLVGEEKRS